MTSKNRLILKIEGPERSGHHLDLSVFAEKTRQFLNFLKISAKDSGQDRATFHIVNISHSSPITLECTPADQGVGVETPSVIFESIRKNLDLTQNRQTRDLSHPVLDSLEKLTNYKPGKIKQIEILTIADDADSEKVYRLNEEFKENLRDARSKEDRVTNTLDGKLEQINIHNNANTFKIYTATSSVACKFPKNLLENVQGALGNFVSVWGECLYRPNIAFPYKINVRGMEILPPAKDLPSLSDLRGIAPDATQGKSSEQFVRELRDEWDRDSQ